MEQNRIAAINTFQQWVVEFSMQPQHGTLQKSEKQSMSYFLYR
jgi:hypothetical protein